MIKSGSMNWQQSLFSIILERKDLEKIIEMAKKNINKDKLKLFHACLLQVDTHSYLILWNNFKRHD